LVLQIDDYRRVPEGYAQHLRIEALYDEAFGAL
jgi:hypothetical protein